MNKISIFHIDSSTPILQKIITKKNNIHEYIFGICTRGTSTLTINDKTYNFKEGDAIIILPNSTLTGNNVSKNHTGIYITIPESLIHPLAKMEESFQYKFIYSNPICKPTSSKYVLLQDYINLIVDSYHTETPHSFSKLSLESLISSYQLEFIGQFLDCKYKMSKYIGHPYFRVFEIFLSSVRNKHRKHREVQHYAEKQNMSRRYFSRIIKQVSDQSAKEWINAEILQTIKNLLQQTNFRINEIAAELNFSSPSALNEFFKKEMGVTPTEYREMKTKPISYK